MMPINVLDSAKRKTGVRTNSARTAVNSAKAGPPHRIAQRGGVGENGKRPDAIAPRVGRLLPRRNKTSTITVGTAGTDTISAIAVNPVTNKVYVGTAVNNLNASMTVIDVATNSTNRFALIGAPGRIVVNSVTNRIYVTQNGNMTVIDGTNNSTSLVSGMSATSMVAAINPATNRIYSGSRDSGIISVIAGTTDYKFCGFPTP